MKEILIIGGVPTELGRSIAPAVRRPGRLASGYFGKSLESKYRHFDWSTISLVLVGLNVESQRLGSPQHEIKGSDLFDAERSVVQKAAEHGIPIGILCDLQGTITAPYLNKAEVRNGVVIVFANHAPQECHIGEIYGERTKLVLLPNEPTEAVSRIVREIAELIPAQKMAGVNRPFDLDRRPGFFNGTGGSNW